MSRQHSFNRRSQNSGKQWVHSPETLTAGHVTYNVKFLGHVEVDHPKGSDMVRDAIRKMKFNKQIKKAEGYKPPKVELLISIDAITVQEPKSKVVQFQYPLHQVSYCADDKSDKKMFTFIAKDKVADKHNCYVFDSEKCAEEITLTLGQAFDLAYKRFLDSSSKNVDTKKQLLVLQQKVHDLTSENIVLKEKVATLEKLLEHAKQQQQQQQQHNNVDHTTQHHIIQHRTSDSTAAANGNLPLLSPPPPVPSRSHIPAVSPLLHQTDPFSSSSSPPLSAQFPPVTPPHPRAVGPAGDDVFGMPAFSPSTVEPFQFEQATDRDIMDMHANFSRGLSIGTEDFSLDDFDPCKK